MSCEAGHCPKEHWTWGGTCCRECGRRWKSVAEGHCASCHFHFRGTAFNDHQSFTEYGEDCLPPEKWQNRTKGDTAPQQLVATQTEFGVTWRWRDVV